MLLEDLALFLTKEASVKTACRLLNGKNKIKKKIFFFFGKKMEENLKAGMELFGPRKFFDFRFYCGIMAQVLSITINSFLLAILSLGKKRKRLSKQ